MGGPAGGLPAEVVLTVGDVEVAVDLDEGARATRWSVGGRELLARHADDPVERGMYPMAPWAGRIRGNAVQWDGRRHELPPTYDLWALHGTALSRAARVLEYHQDAVSAALVARIDAHPGWPWPMAVDIGWSVTERRVTTTITVHALAEPFPVVVGWHPWFRRELGAGGSIEWWLEATQRLERGSDHLPTGRLLDYDPAAGPFDDAFVVPGGRAGVRWPGVLAIDVESDGGWFVVFDELPDAACVEPQSGPPDGLHDGYGRPVAVAAPGRPHVMVTTWSISDDPPGDRA